MAGAITDKFAKASNGTAPVPTTLAAQKNLGVFTCTLNGNTGWPTATTSKINFKMYQLDTSNKLIAGTESIWQGLLTGTTISSMTLKGGSDATYPATTTVVQLMPTSAMMDDLFDGLTAQHSQLDGSHTNVVATSLDVGTQGNNKDGGVALMTMRGETMTNFVYSGCVWSGDAYGSTRNASMTAGVVYIGGKRVAVNLVTARAFTASKDTYVDVDNTGTLTYTEVANNAASPSLAANNIRLAIIVTGATNIAASTSIGQGGFANTVPVISSQTLRGFDSLGNVVYPRGPAAPTLIQNPYKFRVYRSGALNTASSVVTKLPYETKTFDTGNNYDATTNFRFTAPVAGYYNFSANMGVTNPAGYIQIALYKNGVSHSTGNQTFVTGANNYLQSVNDTIQLAAGDYVEVFYYVDGIKAVVAGSTNCYFSGFLVSVS